MYAHSVALGADRAWFNGHFTHSPELIGWVDIWSGAVKSVPVPDHPTMGKGPGGPIPYEIRVAPDGRLWGGELQGNRVFAYAPATGTFTMYTLPTAQSGPRRFDIDPDGIVWIPAYSSNALVRLDPATGTFTEIPLPVKDAVPYVVRVDPRNGALWIGTSAADALFRYDPRAKTFAGYPLPGHGALVRHMAIDPKTGAVWLAYGESPGMPARVARVTP
jgi:streptogramin lyase